ncbi:MAG: trypsin-like peptidase domain-containing protein [Sedimentisphaerales bacterium]|nr:trypsin-like peptidase domain-containing protein [Sedimentisphaerales bacterium]
MILLYLLSGLPSLGMAQDSMELEKSVVLIRGVSQDYDYTLPWKQESMRQGTGTGFIIEGRRILTNAHNVSNSKYVEVKKEGLARKYPARVAYIGHDCDLAIIQPMDPGFYDGTVPLELGGIPRVNTTVSTIGFPVGGEHVSITEGVVSRVQMDAYSHTGADSHLVIQTDAAINPGNSGGPVVQGGKVVGVAFQGLRQADNIGYMIPTTVIRHFLADIEDSTYDGFGSLGFQYFPGLHNNSYQEYLKVPPDEEGIVIVDTLLNSSAEDILRSGDVITAIDAYDVDNDGKVRIDGLRLQMSEVIERKLIGDYVEITFYRDGERHIESVEIRLNRGVLEIARQYDEAPDYVVYAGLVFVPVTRNFLETWGGDWPVSIPFYLRYLFRYSDELNTDRPRQEYVVISEVLPDEVNAYADDFLNLPVADINGIDIWSIADVPRGFVRQQEGYHIIQFMGGDRPLIIDAQKAGERQDDILTQYEVPESIRIKQ